MTWQNYLKPISEENFVNRQLIRYPLLCEVLHFSN